MLAAGWTFFFPQETENHRWVIVSDPEKHPDQPVVIVNFTTFKSGKEPTCVVSPKDFPSLARDSCIHYVKARSVPLSNLQELISKKKIRFNSCVSLTVLEKIREGFGKSKEPVRNLKDILRRQGLIG